MSPEIKFAGRLLGARLAAGGTTEVFRCEGEEGESLVLKRLHPELIRQERVVERFERGVTLQASVESRAIPRVRRRGRVEGQPFYEEDWIDAPTLSEKFRRSSPSRTESLCLAKEIARGLASIHEAGIVHRDLKAPNLLALPKGKVMILDFGLACRVGARSSSPGRALGSPSSMAPEQLLDRPVDERCDLYALGVLLYRMLSGSPAFHPADAADMLEQRRRGPAALPKGPEAVLVGRLLAMHPRDRPNSAKELVGLIDAVLASSL